MIYVKARPERFANLPVRADVSRANPEDFRMAHKPIVATHVKDIEWIISLWFAIHGGDPAPEVRGELTAKQAQLAAAGLIRAAAVHLDPAHAKAVTAAMG
jgi:hypothetical protein